MFGIFKENKLSKSKKTENIFHCLNKRTLALKLLFFLLIIAPHSELFSQNFDNHSFVVDSIRIVGNEKTKDYIILRELTFTKGDTVNDAILRFNRERVYSLGIFNKVEMAPIHIKGKTIVFILIKESWYIYPLPMLSFQNSQWDKVSYGLDFLWKNFRGRNETLHFIAAFGYNPVYAINYYTPVFAGMRNISLNALLSFGKVDNQSKILEKYLGEEFNYKCYSGLIGFGERINIFNELIISAGYQYTEQPFVALSPFTASGTRIDRMPVMKLNYILDTRNLKQFSSKGNYLQTEYWHKGFGLCNISYNIFALDLRRYQPLSKKFTAKVRIMARHIWGRKIPYYDHSYFDYREIIRGHSLDYREGDNAFKTSFDINYSILDELNFSTKLPLVPRKLTSARIGVKISLFYDTGLTFNNKAKIKSSDFSSGYGAGIVILFLPYNALRVEYAFNELGKGELLIGTGFAF